MAKIVKCYSFSCSSTNSILCTGEIHVTRDLKYGLNSSWEADNLLQLGVYRDIRLTRDQKWDKKSDSNPSWEADNLLQLGVYRDIHLTRDQKWDKKSGSNPSWEADNLLQLGVYRDLKYISRGILSMVWIPREKPTTLYNWVCIGI